MVFGGLRGKVLALELRIEVRVTESCRTMNLARIPHEGGGRIKKVYCNQPFTSNIDNYSRIQLVPDRVYEKSDFTFWQIPLKFRPLHEFSWLERQARHQVEDNRVGGLPGGAWPGDIASLLRRSS